MKNTQKPLGTRLGAQVFQVVVDGARRRLRRADHDTVSDGRDNLQLQVEQDKFAGHICRSYLQVKFAGHICRLKNYKSEVQ